MCLDRLNMVHSWFFLVTFLPHFHTKTHAHTHVPSSFVLISLKEKNHFMSTTRKKVFSILGATLGAYFGMGYVDHYEHTKRWKVFENFFFRILLKNQMKLEKNHQMKNIRNWKRRDFGLLFFSFHSLCVC